MSERNRFEQRQGKWHYGFSGYVGPDGVPVVTSVSVCEGPHPDHPDDPDFTHDYSELEEVFERDFGEHQFEVCPPQSTVGYFRRKKSGRERVSELELMPAPFLDLGDQIISAAGATPKAKCPHCGSTKIRVEDTQNVCQECGKGITIADALLSGKSFPEVAAAFSLEPVRRDRSHDIPRGIPEEQGD
jgi:hypothetical protein